MGSKDSKAFTENGVKNIQLSLLLSVPFIIGIFLTAFISSAAFIAIFAVGAIIVLLFYIKGMGDMLSGREELGDKHSSNVVMATVLSAIAIIVFLFLIISTLISSSIFLSFSWVNDPIPFFIAAIFILALSIAFMALFGLALIFYIREIIPSEKKYFMWISFGLFVAFPILSIFIVTLHIFLCIVAGLILILPLVLFVICYKNSYLYLKSSGIKAVPLIPCPFCERIIPVNSTSCRHCGTKFEKPFDEAPDPRLSMDVPKTEYSMPRGYTPVEGPSEKQKKRVKILFSLIIVLIVVVAAVFIIFSKSDNDRFVGEWRMQMTEELSSAFNDNISTLSWTFYDNGSMKFSLIDKDGTENKSTIAWGSWGIKDDKLYTLDPSTQTVSLYDTIGVDYEFSNDEKSFEITLGINNINYSVTFNKV